MDFIDVVLLTLLSAVACIVAPKSISLIFAPRDKN
jgi:hypothetical protein